MKANDNEKKFNELTEEELKQVNGGFTSGKIKPNVVEEIKKRQMIDTSGEIKQEPESSILSRNNSTCIKNMEGE